MKAVCITGGRDHIVTRDEAAALVRLLNKLEADLVLVGDCPTGVDAWVRTWCAGEEELPCKVFKAEWELYGKGAGPRRNALMVELAQAVIFFEGGKGTRNCVSEALRRRVPVYDVWTGEQVQNIPS